MKGNAKNNTIENCLRKNNYSTNVHPAPASYKVSRKFVFCNKQIPVVNIYFVERRPVSINKLIFPALKIIKFYLWMDQYLPLFVYL